MRRLFFALVTGLVGALVLHIVIIFALPLFATRDVYSRIAHLPANGRFVAADTIGQSSPAAFLADTPYITTQLCRFAIGDFPVHLSAEGAVPFWSLVVFDERSNEIFSMNDRTAEGSGMNVTLASPLQMIRLRESVPPGLADSVLVETASAAGYVLLRTVIPDQTFRPQAEAFLASATCEPLEAA